MRICGAVEDLHVQAYPPRANPPFQTPRQEHLFQPRGVGTVAVAKSRQNSRTERMRSCRLRCPQTTTDVAFHPACSGSSERVGFSINCKASLCFCSTKTCRRTSVATSRWSIIRNQPMKQIPIHKGGRPAISEGRRKKYLLSLRLDAEHYFKLKSLVRTSGHGTAEVLRLLIAAGHVRERLRREHLDFMSQLKGMARNLNQLTRLAHAKGFTGIVSRHAAIVVEIESLLKNLRDDR